MDSLQTGNDGFAYSEHFAEDALPDASEFDTIPVDPENPGFASLLKAIKGVRQGAYPVEILDGYVVGLAPRISTAFAQLEMMHKQPVGQMGLNDEQVQQLQAALTATEAALGEMNTVLELCERSLDSGDLEALEEAEGRLTLVHSELKQVL